MTGTPRTLGTPSSVGTMESTPRPSTTLSTGTNEEERKRLQALEGDVDILKRDMVQVKENTQQINVRLDYIYMQSLMTQLEQSRAQDSNIVFQPASHFKLRSSPPSMVPPPPSAPSELPVHNDTVMATPTLTQHGILVDNCGRRWEDGCVIGCLKARPIPFLSNDNVVGAVMMCFMRGPPISTIFPTLVT